MNQDNRSLKRIHRFKTIYKIVSVKPKFNNFITENSDLKLAVNEILNFAIKSYAVVSNSFEDYENGYRMPKRVILANLVLSCSFITFTRFLCSSIFANKFIIILMSDANNH